MVWAKHSERVHGWNQLQFRGVGVRWGPIWLEFRSPTPLCACCAAQSNFAELHAHTALMSNVGQRLLDFYIAAAEQWLACLERVSSKSWGRAQWVEAGCAQIIPTHSTPAMPVLASVFDDISTCLFCHCVKWPLYSELFPPFCLSVRKHHGPNPPYTFSNGGIYGGTFHINKI